MQLFKNFLGPGERGVVVPALIYINVTVGLFALFVWLVSSTWSLTLFCSQICILFAVCSSIFFAYETFY